MPVASLDATVHIVPAALAADGTLVDAALEAGADGLVGVVARRRPHAAAVPRGAQARRRAGAGRRHRAPGARLDPARTYAFEGSERDLRAGPLICAGALTPAAARIKLMACLGAGYARGAIAGAFAPDDF